MKKIFLLIIIIIILQSCRTYAPPDKILYDNGLVDFAIDIAQNPDKLYKLKKYYPQFYDEKYLHISLKDTLIERYKYRSNLDDRIDRIKKEFSTIDEKIIPVDMFINQNVIKELNRIWETNYNFEGKELYSLSLFKECNNVSLDFIFVRTDSIKFNIFWIKKDKIKVEL